MGYCITACGASNVVDLTLCKLKCSSSHENALWQPRTSVYCRCIEYTTRKPYTRHPHVHHISGLGATTYIALPYQAKSLRAPSPLQTFRQCHYASVNNSSTPHDSSNQTTPSTELNMPGVQPQDKTDTPLTPNEREMYQTLIKAKSLSGKGGAQEVIEKLDKVCRKHFLLADRCPTSG